MDRSYESDLLAVARRHAISPPAIRFDPVQRWYARVAAEPNHEVWLLSWLPGQGTELHDHGGSVGAFLVLSGVLTEEVVSGGTLCPRPLVAGAGRQFGPRHVHRVTNQGDQPAVSLHVYRPALRQMTRYRLVDGQLRVAEVAHAGVAW